MQLFTRVRDLLLHALGIAEDVSDQPTQFVDTFGGCDPLRFLVQSGLVAAAGIGESFQVGHKPGQHRFQRIGGMAHGLLQPGLLVDHLAQPTFRFLKLSGRQWRSERATHDFDLAVQPAVIGDQRLDIREQHLEQAVQAVPNLGVFVGQAMQLTFQSCQSLRQRSRVTVGCVGNGPSAQAFADEPGFGKHIGVVCHRYGEGIVEPVGDQAAEQAFSALLARAGRARARVDAGRGFVVRTRPPDSASHQVQSVVELVDVVTGVVNRRCDGGLEGLATLQRRLLR
ncbi:MAG: hypothetical protein IOMNBAOH_00985 [Rhodocyclaceae bacterium]|nr:hypothetical protein [Rhodocyclaceae bacterium]